MYVLRALEDIENEMYEAFHSLEDALFVEYWGEKIPHEKRVEYWLNKADSYMKEWSDIMPSNVLFLNIK